ncbi:hypothetical protein [uncultured Legionella sp.]|uniref:hypothetical protein n=1 Tax=uncultured Legionella sp. TaxID=210934 RepID=UPI0026237A3F|nr:hypothetical protein [uncultured Legionella sp.]
MQKKSDVSSKTYQNIIENEENTMSTELSAGVGLVLLQLARHFSDSRVKGKSKATVSTEQVNRYIAADDTVKEAWNYIESKLNEEVNRLDKITTWVEGQETTRYIELRTALALVYAG